MSSHQKGYDAKDFIIMSHLRLYSQCGEEPDGIKKSAPTSVLHVPDPNTRKILRAQRAKLRFIRRCRSINRPLFRSASSLLLTNMHLTHREELKNRRIPNKPITKFGTIEDIRIYVFHQDQDEFFKAMKNFAQLINIKLPKKYHGQLVVAEADEIKDPPEEPKFLKSLTKNQKGEFDKIIQHCLICCH